MQDTKIIDGRKVAADLHADLTQQVATLSFKPSLVAVLVGDDPASSIYVKRKHHIAQKIGLAANSIRLPAETSERQLLDLIGSLNADSEVDGILVQLPLPAHIRTAKVIDTIDPMKDVDAFHPVNVGRLGSESFCPLPCTPKGIMHLLEASGANLSGARTLVVGCSPIVGRPASLLLSKAGATVTMAHKQTRDLAAECRQADIIVSAAGRPDLIRGAHLREGAVVIDVGINRLADGKIVGDVAFSECLGIASAITPVPGGVGPMTIACLMENTIELAQRRR